jgi:glycosyltransferase A (GT-A) superfamily protein (DUF2064 family)
MATALGRPQTSSGDALVIVAKFPKAHEVKTRLGASIGYENAAQLYRAFLCDLSERFAIAQATASYHLYWSCGPTIHVLTTVIGPDATILPQRGAEFADRLYNISSMPPQQGISAWSLWALILPSSPLGGAGEF